MHKTLLVLLLSFLYIYLFAQDGQANEAKEMTAHRTDAQFSIDGKLDEPEWETVDAVSNFTLFQPNPGRPKRPTEVKIFYDDEALYIGAFMKEYSSDSIMMELVERDDIGNTDWFGVILDTYGNASEAAELIVMSTGVQFDAYVTSDNGEDYDWNAVWFSEVHIAEEGWYVEMKVPYAALRFPKVDVQNWRINFMRRRATSGTKGSWQPIDFKLNNAFLTCMATVNGVRGIKPPLRLSVSPYASVYAIHNSDPTDGSSTGFSYNAGLDLKYGINEAFTLDMVLIPDFGQVRSDDQILNLSPFEVQFSENRQFFTEGVSLFTKAGIFYSRRVGGTPVSYYDVEDDLGNNEVIDKNPQAVQLLNATKVSGRTEGGLGIGFFNAVSKKTEATIINTESGSERSFITQPLTNYNMIVLDQNLKNNSSLTFSNTSVLRDGAQFDDANVAAAGFDIKLKDQKYRLDGNINYSYVSEETEDAEQGHDMEVGFFKIQGKWNYGGYYEQTSDTYNHNDLGFLRYNNSREVGFEANYSNPEKGFWKFSNFNFWNYLSRDWLYSTNAPIGLNYNIGFYGQTKNLHATNMWFNASPDKNDFFEAREDGRVYISPAYINGGWWYGTDVRKAFRVNGSLYGTNTTTKGRHSYGANVNLRYRFNDKLSSTLLLNTSRSKNGEGYVNSIDDDIIFGIRDVVTNNNRLSVTYTFNSKMSLDTRLRHYWSKVSYNGFRELLLDGSLGVSSYDDFHDFAFTAFNVDMVYTWRFAPGSDLSLVWKNNIAGSNNDELINFKERSYFESIEEMADFPKNNSLSLRAVYYLDYANLAARF